MLQVTRPRAQSLIIFAAYALMCSIWGTTWLGIKVSLQYVPPIAGAGLRFIIAGIVMYAFAAMQHKLVPPRQVPWKLVLVLAAFLFGLNYILTYTAETHVSSGLTAVLFGVTPFFMFFVLWSSLRNGKPATARVWEGALGLEWTVPSPAPHHTFTVPPVIRDGDLAHGDFAHKDYD